MTHEVVTETATARPIAAVRARARSGEVSSAFRPALDRVWAFLRRHDGLWTNGHNVFVYRHASRPGEPMEILFGVETTGVFEDEDGVVLAWTPAGPVARTLHVGPYDGLADAHAAIDAWRAARGREFAGYSWEVYGHATDDPTKQEVEVVYLLA